MKQIIRCILFTALLVTAGCKKGDDGAVEMMTPEEIGDSAEQVAENTQEAVEALTVKAEDVMADLGQSVEQIKEKAANFEAEQLQAYVDEYKDIILEKKDQVAQLTEQLKEMSMTEMMSDKAKALKEKMSQYSTELESLKARYQVYLDKLTAIRKGSEL